MKTKKAIVCFICAVLLIACVFSGCTSKYEKNINLLKNIPESTENFAKDKKCTLMSNGKEKNAQNAIDGNINTAVKSCAKTGEIVLDFREEKTFNTVVLSEKGWNVQNFRFYKLTGLNDDGTEKWEEFYHQDRIEDIRICNFEPITSSKLRIVVDNSHEPFKLNEIQVFNLKKTNIDFDVSAYVRNNEIVEFYKERNSKNAKHRFDKEYFDVVTQVIIIGGANYNKDGQLSYTSDDVPEEEWVNALNYFKDFCGEDTVFIQTAYIGENATRDFGENKEKTIKSTVEFLDKFNLDGINYDWEFPKGEQYDIFSDFLVSLKPALNDKILSCAWYSWGINLSDEAIKAHDQIEIMGYDTYDQNGNNNAFLGGCVQNIEYFIDKGVEPSKIRIGMSYYARPADDSEVWIDYDNFSTPPNRWNNYYQDPVSNTRMYYNSPQMVRDKTAYAIARGIGGVMIFHLTEDLPYNNDNCLTKSVGETINSLTVQNGGASNENA